MQDKPTWEKVPNVAGFYRMKRAGGYAYRFRFPGERTWTSNNEGLGLEEAKRWRNKLLGSERHERVIPTQITFLAYATDWIASTPTLKARTRRLYASQLRLHLTPLHKLKLHEIDIDTLRFVMTRMTTKGLAPSSVRNALVTASSVLSAAVDDKVIKINPVSQLGKRQRPKVAKSRKRILKPAEAAKLIELSPPSVKPIVAVMLFAGLRISEALGLTWGDIDFTGRKLHVWRQLAYSSDDVTMGDYWTELKGEEGDAKERNVELSNVLRSILLAHRGDRIVHRDDLVFVTSNATPFSQRNTQRQFKVAVIAAGLDNEPKLTPHQCRHNFVSALIASGADVGFVADQVGHADPNVTLEIYRHEFKEAREAGTAAAAIDRIYGAAMG